MRIRMLCIVTLGCLSGMACAASVKLMWGKSDSLLQQYPGIPLHQPSLLTPLKSMAGSPYGLRLLTTAPHHARYQILFKGLPVWGYQLIFHQQDNQPVWVTGMNIRGLERTIKTTKGLLSVQQLRKRVLAKAKGSVKWFHHQKVVYLDNQQQAHLAYHMTYYIHTPDHTLHAPQMLVDADTGQVFKAWDAVHREQWGQGLGGNAFPLPYRPGSFQHGDALPGLPSLGKFEVRVKDGRCYVESDSLRVINMANLPLGYEAFPISTEDENTYELTAFSYVCDSSSYYLNYNDANTGPVNYSFSPVNDAMYFATQTLAMYESNYQQRNPLGTDLPLRVYTHLSEMDNAFAIPTVSLDGQLMAHQQIIIGNGHQFLTAPAQTVIAHELSHNFTELHSALVYEGQSGAINEAFSDMAAIALQDYIRQSYPWYWDGLDWTIGREAVLGGAPLRYMDEPGKDGMSIEHAREYTDDLDVHLSSGVYNKAFYRLANKPGWTVQKAFQVMIDANRFYWSPIAYYDFAACGVIQAAHDRQWDTAAVKEAFAEVGVVCPVLPKPDALGLKG